MFHPWGSKRLRSLIETPLALCILTGRPKIAALKEYEMEFRKLPSSAFASDTSKPYSHIKAPVLYLAKSDGGSIQAPKLAGI